MLYSMLESVYNSNVANIEALSRELLVAGVGVEIDLFQPSITCIFQLPLY